ncbi:MAG: Hpt domain-containing protein, partial [Syntrophobacteraceae bacterium]
NGNGFIDHAALDKIAALQREGQPSLLHKIIDMYFQSSPDLLQKIREAVRSSDAPSLHRAAHTLKSSSANLGAFKLAELCKEMETMGKTNVLLEAGTMLSTIEKEYEGVRQALAIQIQEG